MSTKSDLGKLKDRLIFELDQNNQREALKALWIDGSSEALKVMSEALKAPQVAIKDEILSYLSFKDSEIVFQYLLDVMDACTESVRKDLIETIEKLDLVTRYLDKIETFREVPSRYPLVAGIIRLLGKTGHQDFLKQLPELYPIDNDIIKLSVIEALEFAEVAVIPDCIFDSLQNVSSVVVERFLALIQRSTESVTVTNLVRRVSANGDPLNDRIMETLQAMDQMMLEKAVVEHLGSPDEEDVDQPLLKAWMAFLGQTGRKDDAKTVLETYTAKVNEQSEHVQTAIKKTTMLLEVKNIEGAALIEILGSLDVHSLPKLEKTLKTMVKSGCTKIVIECGHL